MFQKFLGVCTLSGVGGSVSIALYFWCIMAIGGLMEGNPIRGLLMGFMYFLPLAFLGALCGGPTGFAVGLLVGLIHIPLREKIQATRREKLISTAIIAFLLGFAVYYRWLVSQAPLIDFS